MDDKIMKELYDKKIAELKLADFKDDEEVKKLLDDFSEKSFLLPETWLTRLRIEEKYNTNYNNSREQRYEFYCKIYKPISKKALSHFYSEKLFYSEWLNLWFRTLFIREEKPFDRIMNCEHSSEYIKNPILERSDHQSNVPKLNNFLSFPHSKLSTVFQWYREFSESPMTKDVLQMYQKNKKLYEKIKAAEDDLEKWFTAVLEVEDERFVIQNVECKIAANPFNTKLWKLYLKYLSTKNRQAANEVYFRYRKLFADDKSMESKFPKIGSKNIVEEECEYLKSMKYKSADTSAENEAYDHSPKMFFNYKIPPKPQKFSFRSTVIYYLTKNAFPEVTQKLYHTCKYFFFKSQDPICHSLYIGNKYKYLKHSLVLDLDKLNLTNFKNLTISNSFCFIPYAPTPEVSVMLLSKFLPKIASCNARYLEIRKQNLSVDEYYFLTKSKRVEKIQFYDVTITDEKHDHISLEQFFYTLPSAYYIEYIDIRISSKTRNILRHLKRSKKIDNLWLRIMNIVPKELQVEDIISFLDTYTVKADLRFAVRDETTTLFIDAINN